MDAGLVSMIEFACFTVDMFTLPGREPDTASWFLFEIEYLSDSLNKPQFFEHHPSGNGVSSRRFTHSAL